MVILQLFMRITRSLYDYPVPAARTLAGRVVARSPAVLPKRGQQKLPASERGAGGNGRAVVRHEQPYARSLSALERRECEDAHPGDTTPLSRESPTHMIPHGASCWV